MNNVQSGKMQAFLNLSSFSDALSSVQQMATCGCHIELQRNGRIEEEEAEEEEEEYNQGRRIRSASDKFTISTDDL